MCVFQFAIDANEYILAINGSSNFILRLRNEKGQKGKRASGSFRESGGLNVTRAL